MSVSRRTDVPALYSEWFARRLREGYVLVRNPMRYHQVARIRLDREVIDGIVLWTKNPAPMLGKLDVLTPYPYYFRYTLTPYAKDIEPGVPPKGCEGIETFRRLADSIGPDRVVWMYDPILISTKYTSDWHIRYFEQIARKLEGYTTECTIAFIAPYKSTCRNASLLMQRPIGPQEMRGLAARLCEIANACGMRLSACAEPVDYSAVGVERSACVDAARFERIAGYRLSVGKDRNQRGDCRCAMSIDIGSYNCCTNGCLYCYANYQPHQIARNVAAHDPKSPLLIGQVQNDDIVYSREIRTFMVT